MVFEPKVCHMSASSMAVEARGCIKASAFFVAGSVIILNRFLQTEPANKIALWASYYLHGSKALAFVYSRFMAV